MPSYLVANCMSVSAPVGKSTGIFEGFVDAMVGRQVDVGLFVECKDFRAADHVPAGWTVVQDGPGGPLVVVARPGVQLGWVGYWPVTPAKAEKSGKRRKVGPRGILTVDADGQRFNVGHAPLGWTGMRDQFLHALASLDGVSVGDFNAGRRDVQRIFTSRTVHGGTEPRQVIYAAVPADHRTVLDVVGKGLNGADHEALVVTTTTHGTAPVVTPPKPTQPPPAEPQTPSKEPTVAESQNGYTANDRSRVESRTVPGTTVRLAVVKGAPGVLLVDHVAKFFHENVEPIIGGGAGFHPADDWGYAERPIRGSSKLSNHASGTAIDLNATRHPLGVRGTFTTQQKATMHAYLKALDGCIRWGEDYLTRKDGMHFEIMRDPETCARVVEKLTNVNLKPGTRDLEQGDVGSDVRWVQEQLKIDADGIFGPQTKKAVRDYERAHNKAKLQPRLKVDGIVGTGTWEALMGRANGEEPPRVTPPKPPKATTVSLLREELSALIDRRAPRIDADRPVAQSWVQRLRDAVKSGPAR